VGVIEDKLASGIERKLAERRRMVAAVRAAYQDGRWQAATSVRVSPDNFAERGGHWVLDGFRVVQLLDGETELPKPTVVTVPWNQEQQDIAALALHRMAFSAPDSEVSAEMREHALAAHEALTGNNN